MWLGGVVQTDLVGGMTLWYGVWRICADVGGSAKDHQQGGHLDFIYSLL